MNNYIVTFEYRVMVTAFAILAMFRFDTSLALLLITLCLKENEDSKDYKWTNIGSDYSGDKSDDGARVAKCSVFFQK